MCTVYMYIEKILWIWQHKQFMCSCIVLHYAVLFYACVHESIQKQKIQVYTIAFL